MKTTLHFLSLALVLFATPPTYAGESSGAMPWPYGPYDKNHLPLDSILLDADAERVSVGRNSFEPSLGPFVMIKPEPEYEWLGYRPLSLDLRVLRRHDGLRIHPVRPANLVPPIGPVKLESLNQTPWPYPPRMGARPEHLIDFSYEVPFSVFDMAE